MQQKKREKILVSQARATETMAKASLRKANALQDQCAMSLFTMPLEEGMTEEAKDISPSVGRRRLKDWSDA